MFGEFLNILGAGLNLWADKEKHKYQDKYLDLSGKWHVETNKPDADRDDLVISNLEFELRELGRSFVFAAAGPGPTDQS